MGGVDADINTGMGVAKALEPGHQPLGAKGRRHADREGSPGIPCTQCLHRLGELIETLLQARQAGLAGVGDIDPTRGPQFSLLSMAEQAAIEGHGVALGSSVLVADDLAAGRLIKPFDLSFPVSFAYYVVCPETSADQPRIAAFREWIMAEATADLAPTQSATK